MINTFFLYKNYKMCYNLTGDFMENCINLYLQSEYTLLSSLIKINDIPTLAKELNYDSFAICDDEMYGALKFYNVCVNNNIKPIIGLKVTFTNDNYNSSLLLYAMNEIGYKNLLKICTLKNIDKNNFQLDSLSGLTLGVLCVIPCFENEVIKYYLNNNVSKAQYLLNLYKNLFHDLYLGVDLQHKQSYKLIDYFIDYGNKNNIKSVAINKTAYVNDEDVEAYKILKSIQINNKNYTLLEEEYKMSFLSSTEMELLFNKYPSLLKNTIEIKNKCNVIIKFENYKLPVYDVEDSKQYLEQLAKVGLNKRLTIKQANNEKYVVNEYKNRLLYELNIINKMGFTDYFLIVFDYVRYAKTNDICVGPGRGSAGGSLVSYCLGITEIDPIKYNLLFERFLNPERLNMPDIDVDFPDDKRDEVIKYIGQRFGKTRVAHINTFGTFKPRLAIRDVARIMGINDNKLKEVMKDVPQASNCSLQEILNNGNYLQKLVENDEEINKLIKYALKIENLPRNCSTHAAGIIMADKPLDNYTALQEGINGLYQTQFEASDLEQLGLVKMDVLGIRNLSIIKNVIDDVYEKTGTKIKLNNIDLNDSNVMRLLKKGDTLGIFQLESDGVRKLLIEMQCSSLEDIVNATSLYRPGPMEMIPMFIKRKFGEKYELIHQDLKEILEETYGIIVFQEQIMLIAKKFAGYSLGEADILRRAISKKKVDLIKTERIKFIQSSVKNGYPENKAIEIYDYIEKFANYGFNKSHGVAYGLIAYQMAYLKTYYYKSFMASLMTNNIGSVNSLMKYIMECKKNKVNIFIPSINISSNKFVDDEKGIYYPLLGINNMGDVVVKEILSERQKGLFKNYDDFILRTANILTKKQFINLVNAGALDCFNHTRKSMTDMYDIVLQKVKYLSILGKHIIDTDFNDDEYDFETISNLEKEALGFNLQYSHFNRYIGLKNQYNCNELSDYSFNKVNNSIIIVKYIRVIKTKKGDEMAFVDIFDDTMEMSGVMFPTTFTKFKDSLQLNKTYLIKYNVEKRNEKIQAVIDGIYFLD